MSLFHAILAGVAFFGGVLKSGFGMGGIFLTPVLALVTDPKEAVALVAPMMLFTDITALYQYRRWDTKYVMALLPPCLIGAVSGAFLLDWFTPLMARRSIGIIALVYLGTELFRKTLFRPSHRPSLLWGTITGLVGGVATSLANSGGVFLIAYLARRLPKLHYMGTLMVIFFSFSVVKVVMFSALGLLTKQVWFLELYLIPLMLIGGLTGNWVNRHLPEALFKRLVLFLVTGACVKLIFF